MPKRKAYLALAAMTCLAAPSMAMAQDNTVGEDAYRTSCAVCHGASGLGDGEFANQLTTRPPT